MRKLLNFNKNWIFENSEVCLPHNAIELPFNYFDEKTYQREFIYEKIIIPNSTWDNKEVSVVFEAAMANTQVFLNNKKIISHTDGYSPFTARLTDELQKGENILKFRHLCTVPIFLKHNQYRGNFDDDSNLEFLMDFHLEKNHLW